MAKNLKRPLAGGKDRELIEAFDAHARNPGRARMRAVYFTRDVLGDRYGFTGGQTYGMPVECLEWLRKTVPGAVLDVTGKQLASQMRDAFPL